MKSKSNISEIIADVSRWVENAVIGLDLCPFAKNSRNRDAIRYSVSLARSDEKLLFDLAEECSFLKAHASVETTLLIVPQYLRDFDDFNQFLDLAEALLAQMKWTGIYQFASFHPEYRFAGTDFDDRENWTNRSPYPVIHILRETSLSRAIDSYPNVEEIPLNNIQRMKRLDNHVLESIFFADKHKTDVSS